MANLEDAALLIGKRADVKMQRVYRREESVDVKVREAGEKHLERFH